MVHYSEKGRHYPIEEEHSKETGYPDVNIRDFRPSDAEPLAKITKANFRDSMKLAPLDVQEAYIGVNTASELRRRADTEGREIIVAESANGDIIGYALVTFRPSKLPFREEPEGDLDIQRFHVAQQAQGREVGKSAVMPHIVDLTKELNLAKITTNVSGNARGFFEKMGFNGWTMLHEIDTGKPKALVYACELDLRDEPLQLYPNVSHVIYAGRNPFRQAYLEELTQNSLPVMSRASHKDDIAEVWKAAKSKAYSVDAQGASPIIVACDTRTDIVTIEDSPARYAFINKGNPKTVQEAKENIRIMRNYAISTGKPAPFTHRIGTYIRDTKDPRNNIPVSDDVTILLSRDALAELASEDGFEKYRDEVYDRYGCDVTAMPAGLAVELFFDKGYVAGINGHEYETLPDKDAITKKTIHLAKIGFDEDALKRRLGYIR